MINRLIDVVNKANLKSDATIVPVGAQVKIHVKIKEGDKERIQIFAGTVIARNGGGSTATYTVRRIAHGVGVERTFPVHTPSVAKIEIEKLGKVRRAKLFYLRYRTGKQSKLREQVGEHKEEKA